MKRFVKDYAKYKKELIFDCMSLSCLDKKDAIRKIDKALELCDCGCISNESAIRIILEV